MNICFPNQDKHFVGQFDYPIDLDTGKDLTGATDLRIYYLKPNGVEGYWTATAIANDDGDLTIVRYELQSADDIDIDGEWEFASWTLIGGRVGKGSIYKHTFYCNIS